MGSEYSNNNNNLRYPAGYQNIKPIIIETKKFDYFIDECVEGTITLQNQAPMVLSDIYLDLFLLENWVCKENDNQSYSDINRQPLLCVKVGINKILKIESDLINLSAGYFHFPFKFRLPNYLQPCFEYPLKDRRGYLRYTLEASLISPYIQGVTSIYLIIKSRPKVLNSPLSYSSVMNVHKWGLFDQGTTQLKVSYLSNNYKFNDSIPLNIEINNVRGKLKVINCEVNFIRKVGYWNKNTGKRQYKFEDVIATKVFTIEVLPMNQKSMNCLMPLEEKEEDKKRFNYSNVQNPYPNMVDISYLMPSTEGAIIRCEYCISVTLHFDSFVTSGYLPKVFLPISLTHQTMEEYNIEKQEDEDLKKAIEISKIEVKKDEDYKEELIDNDNINMSVVDRNKMEKLIDKPSGNDLEKMQPISQSHIVENDYENNALPSIIEIEKGNNNKLEQKNQPNINNININQNNINIEQNNNQINDGNNNILNNNLFCPAPVWNSKNEDDDDLLNPYMSNNNNPPDNNIQMNNIIQNNSFNSQNQINNNKMNNNNNLNNINNNNIEHNQNSNNNQMKYGINNNYPDFNKFSNINNNNDSLNKKDEKSFQTLKSDNNFSVFAENKEGKYNEQSKSHNKEENNKYYDINEL